MTMLSRPTRRPPAIRNLFCLSVFLLAGCNPGGIPQPFPASDSAAAETNMSESQEIVRWNELTGIWQGKSYRDRMGIFSSTPPLPKDQDGHIIRDRNTKRTWTATVEFKVEIEEKLLAIPGVECCWLTLTYENNASQETSKRDFYRMTTGENGKINLRGPAGEFQLTLEDGELHLQGNVRSIGSRTILRQVRANLTKHAPSVSEDTSTTN